MDKNRITHRKFRATWLHNPSLPPTAPAAMRAMVGATRTLPGTVLQGSGRQQVPVGKLLRLPLRQNRLEDPNHPGRYDANALARSFRFEQCADSRTISAAFSDASRTAP